MKTREEYENKFSSTMVTSGQEDVIRMQIELLLDIRELLMEEKEERDLKKTVAERIEAEQRRLSKVKLFDNELLVVV
jgi:type IV secretory pathway VirB4 component